MSSTLQTLMAINNLVIVVVVSFQLVGFAYFFGSQLAGPQVNEWLVLITVRISSNSSCVAHSCSGKPESVSYSTARVKQVLVL